ncbi:Uma2 family endonuclease [Streptomyces sp. NPDC054933]
MTIVELSDRIEIEMAESDELSLDGMFEMLERMPTPEGFKVEIVGGVIYMSPQRDLHWELIKAVFKQLTQSFGWDAQIKLDVRLDLPGYLNGFAPDLFKLADGAKKDERGHWHHEDVEFVLEVISRGTGDNDYGKKKRAYAEGGIPVYVIADPYSGKVHAYGKPEGDCYQHTLTVKFGEEIDLGPFGFDLTLVTEDFPRD